MEREREILLTISHPFIVTCFGSYSDETRLFLLLGVALGGDLYRLIEQLGRVPNAATRFYISSLILALQHMHALDIVYRDLKPENVLLDTRGFVKLCDFGFAKVVVDGRTYTRCGTPEYTAPEMLLNEGVNQACDWWALGVLVVEMLTGLAPFTDANGDDMQTYRNILRGEVTFDDECEPLIQPAAKDLIKSLLTVKVAYRLGYVKGGATEVIEQPWFDGFDWDGLVNLTIDAPWKPAFASADDCSFFEPEDDELLSLQPEEAPSAAEAEAACVGASGAAEGSPELARCRSRIEEADAKWDEVRAAYDSSGATAAAQLHASAG